MAVNSQRAATPGLKSLLKFSGAPKLIASRTYNVRRILLLLADMLAEMYFREGVRPIFLDSLPTVDWPCVERHDNSVFCVERGYGGGIAVDDSFVKFFIKRG